MVEVEGVRDHTSRRGNDGRLMTNFGTSRDTICGLLGGSGYLLGMLYDTRMADT